MLNKNIIYLIMVLALSISVRIDAACSDTTKILIVSGSPIAGSYKGELSVTSTVDVYPNQGIVKKRMLQHKYSKIAGTGGVKGVFNNEIVTLMKLRGLKHVPQLFYVDFPNKTIYIEYGGEKLTKDNLPTNWQQQLREIIADFKERGIQHNDIKNTELLVKNGIIMVVDYGWASSLGQQLPSCWPRRLGSDYKPSWGFDDSFSITKAILNALYDGQDLNEETVKKIMLTIFETPHRSKIAITGDI